MQCIHCGAPIREGMKFCRHCGAPVEIPSEEIFPSFSEDNARFKPPKERLLEEVPCPKCGSPCRADAQFCWKCGLALPSPKPPKPPKPPQNHQPPKSPERPRRELWTEEFEEEDFLPNRKKIVELPRRPFNFDDLDEREPYDDDEDDYDDHWERKRNLVLGLWVVLYLALALLLFFVLPKTAFSPEDGPLSGFNRVILGLFAGDDALSEEEGSRVVDIETIRVGVANIRGNSNANLSNKGFLAEQDGYVFFANANDNGGLYRRKTDGETLSKLNDDRAHYINVVGEWVYYLNSAENDTVYRVDINGGRRECVMANGCSRLYVEGNRIYALTQEGVLFHLDDRGNVIEDAPLLRGISDFQVQDDSIFAYQDGQLYRYGMNSDQGEIIIENAVRFMAEGGRLYSLQDSSGNRLVSSLPDGGNAKDLAIRPFAEISIKDSWIYFTENADGRYFKRISIDGSKVADLMDTAVYDMQISGDFMYFRDTEFGSGVNHRVKLNGSGMEKL